MSIILSNRVKNHVESIVKEHLYLADAKADDAKLLSLEVLLQSASLD